MSKFNKVIRLEDLFENECSRVNTNDYLSSLCGTNVRTGKLFLCYC